MQVLKFGGSSVSTPERIKSIIEIVRPRLQDHLAIVFSAFGGVTDQLIEISKLALEGNAEYKEQVASLEKRHLDAVRALTRVVKQSRVLAEVKALINELEDVLQGIFLVGERTPRTLDFVMSFGERLSAYIISEAFRDEGFEAVYLDTRQVIRTDSQFGHARVDFEVTHKQIQDFFKEVKGTVVVTGFIATSEENQTTTLGRSGSDYTAAILAGALGAEKLEIWTDVDGMMTADPRQVKEAFTIPKISYEEAMELSHFGAKVIFPATMQPAMALRIPIVIKNTFNPAHAGTVISNEAKSDKIIKGISSMDHISLLNVQGSGLLGVVGVSQRLFTVLASRQINVILISQASSEHTICIGIHTSLAAKAKDAIHKEFKHEMTDGLIDEVTATSGLSIVALVGDGMKHQPGSSGRLFDALGKNGVNILAIAQGSSERNISIVVNQTDVSKTLNVLHESFFLSKRKTVHLFLAGVGLIGKALLRQINEQLKTLAETNHLHLKIMGIANSRKMDFSQNGFNVSRLENWLSENGEAMNLKSFAEKIIAMNLPNSVFVDCTAAQDIADCYGHLFEANIAVVTPNKKANSSSYESYLHMREIIHKRNIRFLYETNVGAGLPIISTLNDLLLSGDKVVKIEAVLSGTLNFIFTRYEVGMKFSRVVNEAMEKGYTEPDPRDDLNGTDVARKILILARETGNKLELDEVEIQNLVPPDCRGKMTAKEFLQKLPDYDEHFAKLAADAASRGCKLRYCAALENGKTKAELREVNASHPFYSLVGSDNIVVLMTERYHDRPMVIRGPGAGAEVTAAGVFADIIRIGNYS
ncbi:MAG: bifunctional aspartate kinase/homoserine dehydrogenase I [Candidatus Nephrothrix sp. EaCA]|nr:MAG: bifunctional aspartate kinase/homoserine dehydrogenase I [Candidatus Nephrothrix sp. EaCA]